jgi:hypothetical protein
MTDAQLELSLENLRNRSSNGGSRRPAANTRRWWFERMREIVERARDWEPAPPPRPEQTSFGPLYRQAAIAALAPAGTGADREEQLVCE